MSDKLISVSRNDEVYYRFIIFIILLWVPLSANSKETKGKPEEPVSGPKYKIGVCDWMILKRQKIGSFKLTSELGADGVEVDMGGLGNRELFDNKLRDSHFVQMFGDESNNYGVKIASIAMSAFYAQSFAERENYRDLIADCLATMQNMGVKTAFLPLGVQGDLQKRPEIRQELIRRLKVAGDMAEVAGVIIGIETSLDAASEITLLNEINSPAIKIYYNFQNPLEAGRDIYAELKLLGKERICQIHCTDTDDVTLPYNKRLDLHKIKNVLDDMEWSGWLIVERSRDKNEPTNVKKNFGTNIKYLKTIFQNESNDF
ncbi:sugar phosphate isomerase/epimerase family protein [Proteiniphilum sp. UBA1028]|jgi:sugar phosphate isomerase/epimerase|uniref:sugar phosphate isomerase/epimerase family protein n=1 Tax=Proteiniphilum sp. UBA1028 TaxID=1947251 RepID=UPI0025F07279|nr:sugar phosphate isomerase/epimerase family protein [Proteiniphilum sp. UBA1028]